MYEHAALDLETLDVKHSAIIVSVALVAFNPERLEERGALADEGRGFYGFPDMDIQAIDGRTTDTATIRWWIQQGPAAKSIFNDTIRRESPQQICDRITEWCRLLGVKYIWGYGNTFDNVILRSFYRQYAKSFPVGFRNDLDIRTLENISGKRISELGLERGVAHNAYDDALNQAWAVQHLYERIRRHGTGARIDI